MVFVGSFLSFESQFMELGAFHKAWFSDCISSRWDNTYCSSPTIQDATRFCYWENCNDNIIIIVKIHHYFWKRLPLTSLWGLQSCREPWLRLMDPFHSLAASGIRDVELRRATWTLLL
ncbi:hypothetical protein KIL84_023413 [Mauremys mutica]|uniref:Uncharacterized protein n=1 Tax=Mauremys mutica TaxID=74926 RepID=A0A9D4APP5_9SAUR|nr:hypothetical protein KIL84_023413 [Mauremys mutica]